MTGVLPTPGQHEALYPADAERRWYADRLAQTLADPEALRAQVAMARREMAFARRAYVDLCRVRRARLADATAAADIAARMGIEIAHYNAARARLRFWGAALAETNHGLRAAAE